MEGSGVCQSLPINRKVSEVLVDIKKEYKEEDDNHLMDTSRTESIDFGEKTSETNANMMSTASEKAFWIKNEFMTEPLDIKAETESETEPIDDSNDRFIITDLTDPLHTVTIVESTDVSVTTESMVPKRDKTRTDKGESRYTSYFLWSIEKRQELVSTHPEIDFTGISRELSKMWKKVSKTEKYNWKRRAARLTAKTKAFKSNNKAHDQTTSLTYESSETIKEDDFFRTKNEWLPRQRILDATMPTRGRPRKNANGTAKALRQANRNENRISLIRRIIKHPKCLSSPSPI